MHHLAHTACYLTASVRAKIPILSLFWSWVEGLLVLGCHPLSAAKLKDLCIQPFLPITNGSLDGS